MTRNLLLLILASFFTISDLHAIIIPSAPYNEQNNYRWRSDDGSETTATWKAVHNTPITITSTDLSESQRLRLEFYNSGDDIGTIMNSLQYSINGGTTWTNITTVGTTNHWVLVSSPHVTHESTTTSQIGSGLPGLFIGGKMISNTTAGAVTISAGYKTENEYVIQATNNIAEDTEYLFRINGLDYYEEHGTLNTECLGKITSVTDAEICSPGTSVTLTANALSTNTISWYDEDDILVGTGNTFTTPLLAESTTYYAQANGASGECPSDKVPVNANVSLIDITAHDSFVCGGGAVYLSVTHSPTTAVVNWYSDPEATTLLHSGTNFTTPPLTTTTTYYVTGSTPSCTSTVYPITATVRPLPSVTIDPMRDTVCAGQTVTFTGSTSSNFTYSWDSGETSSTLTTNEYGNHTLTVTDLISTCSNSATAFLDTAVTVSIEGFDFIPLIHTDYKTISFYPINDIGATDYLWNFGDGNTSTERTPTHTYADSGDYFVKLHLSNVCSEDSSSLDIFVLPANTSVEDDNWDKLVNIYPNPTTDILNVSVDPSEKIKNISLYNVAGQIILNQSFIPSSEQKISLEKFPKGQYFIVVTSENDHNSIRQITLQ